MAHDLYLLSHQDDEIAILKSLKIQCNLGTVFIFTFLQMETHLIMKILI